MAKNRKRKKIKPIQVNSKKELDEKLKVFSEKVEHILDAAGMPEVFNMIPPDELEYMFFLRIKGVKIIPDKDCKTPPGIKKFLKKMSSDFMTKQKMTIIPNGKEVSYYDMATTGLSLIYYYVIAKNEGRLKDLPEISEKLDIYVNYERKSRKIYYNITFLGQLAGMFASRYDETYYWCTYKNALDDLGNPDGVDDKLFLHSSPKERLNVEINGQNRPVYRVGAPYYQTGVEWASLGPESIGVKYNISGLTFDVYIQSHAIKRLFERIDCHTYGKIQMFLFFSLRDIKICKNKNGQSLIEYYIENIKIGYFTFEIIGNMVILTTFLFITNNDTPEGEKLAELLNVEKKDKEYLKIDKLSTFMESDIKENDELKNIFIKAGCGGLFNLEKVDTKLDPQGVPSALSIIKYLELDKKEQEETTLTEA